MSETPNLHEVDWSTLPAPENDGAADHLTGMTMPNITLTSTQGGAVNLGNLKGHTVVFAYPRTGPPDEPLPDNWDMIPGARGCTPQACAFRDTYAELKAAGFDHIFGLSTQDTTYQQEAASRLHLQFPLLSDEDLTLTKALNLPTMKVENMALMKRLTFVMHDSLIEKVFYPVFPPDQSAAAVLESVGS